MVDSDSNGITFCQGNFVAMWADIPAAIHRFSDRICFVHFRDVDGGSDSFVECWHDDGPTNMLAAMNAYDEFVDDRVPMRPDHVPTMAGENNTNPDYHMLGSLLTCGYVRGRSECVQTSRISIS